MNLPLWFSNLLFWTAQIALLVLVAALLPRIFPKIRQPRVLLVYWRSLLALSLLLPFAQPWHRVQAIRAASPTFPAPRPLTGIFLMLGTRTRKSAAF